MKTPIKYAAMTSGRSGAGLNQIATIVHPEIELARFSKMPNISQLDGFAGLFLHGISKVPKNLRRRAIIFGMTSFAKFASKNSTFRQDMEKHPVQEIWVNNYTSSVILNRLGLKCKTMYRPSPRLVIPATCPKISKKRVILLYWREGDKILTRHTPSLIRLVRTLKDFEFWAFPGTEKFCNAKNLRMLGKAQPNKVIPSATGMIRLSCLFDLGRSTFDMLGYGRWCLYCKTFDNFIFDVHSFSKLPQQVREIVEADTQEAVRRRWTYARNNFSRQAIHHRWVAAFKEITARMH